MKWYRKINRGFAAALLLLLIIIGWRTSLHLSRRAEEPELERMTQDYLNTAIPAEIVSTELISDFQASGSTFADYKNDEDYQAYYEETKRLMAPFYPADGRYLGFAMNRLEQTWQDQLEAGLPTRVKFTFNGMTRPLYWVDNTVTVDVRVLYENGAETIDMPEEIYMEKTAGEWKIMAADLETDLFGLGSGMDEELYR